MGQKVDKIEKICIVSQQCDVWLSLRHSSGNGHRSSQGSGLTCHPQRTYLHLIDFLLQATGREDNLPVVIQKRLSILCVPGDGSSTGVPNELRNQQPTKPIDESALQVGTVGIHFPQHLKHIVEKHLPLISEDAWGYFFTICCRPLGSAVSSPPLFSKFTSGFCGCAMVLPHCMLWTSDLLNHLLSTACLQSHA